MKFQVKSCKYCKNEFLPNYRAAIFCSKTCSNKCNIRRKKQFKKCYFKDCTEQVDYRASKFCKKCKKLGRQYMKIFDGKLQCERTIGECVKSNNDANKYNSIRRHARYSFNDIENKSCVRCSWPHHVEVCHIKPISDFNSNALLSEVNNPNNLILLCPNCHWLFDKNKAVFNTLPAVKFGSP